MSDTENQKEIQEEQVESKTSDFIHIDDRTFSQKELKAEVKRAVNSMEYKNFRENGKDNVFLSYDDLEN